MRLAEQPIAQRRQNGGQDQGNKPDPRGQRPDGMGERADGAIQIFRILGATGPQVILGTKTNPLLPCLADR
jgi:hypothetical protein